MCPNLVLKERRSSAEQRLEEYVVSGLFFGSGEHIVLVLWLVHVRRGHGVRGEAGESEPVGALQHLQGEGLLGF